MAQRPVSLAEFRRRLWELWQASQRPVDWPQDVARARWRERYPELAWPPMELRTWQRRTWALHHEPEPPETDVERLKQRIGELHDAIRHELMTVERASPLVVEQSLEGIGGKIVDTTAVWRQMRARRVAGLQAELARREAELALLLRLGPPRNRRRARHADRKAVAPDRNERQS